MLPFTVALYPDHLALLSGRHYIPLAIVFSTPLVLFADEFLEEIPAIMILMTRHERLPWCEKKDTQPLH
jgi:hypothetical protein